MILLSISVVLAGCAKKPHGRYVARVQAGASYMELSYDFRHDGRATTWVLSNGGAVAANGTWRLSDGRVLFDGTAMNPKTKQPFSVSHILRFDGDDLFREDLTVRFVWQR